MSAPDPGWPGCEELEARLREAEAALAGLLAERAHLQDQVAALAARLNGSPGASPQPPPADIPAIVAAGDPPSPTEPGVPEILAGAARGFFPADWVTGTVDCLPARCSGCGAPLPAAAAPGDPEPRVHQLGELPPLHLHVTEYRRHRRLPRLRRPHRGDAARRPLRQEGGPRTPRPGVSGDRPRRPLRV